MLGAERPAPRGRAAGRVRLARRRPAAGRDDVEDLARALHALGPANVVVTGGHRDEVTDVFFDGTSITLLAGERHPDGAAHGSGCTHSSALAAHLALGFSPRGGGPGGAAARVGGGARRAPRASAGGRAR